jgi:hypothetical protein
VTAFDESIAQLDGVRAAPSLLRDNLVNTLMAGEQERCDRRSYCRGNLPYQLLRNDPWSTRHRGNESHGIGASFNRDSCLFDAADAANLDS